MDEVFDLKEPEPAREPESEFQFSIPKLPSLVTEVVMPWVLTVACLGSAGYVAVEHILALPGRPVGFGMLAAALLLYAVLLVPLTVKALHSAAITAKLRLPNVIWFQTFSLLALPTAGLVIGLDAGGTGSMITLGILGLAAMFVLMALMLRADVMQSVAAAFYAGSAYVGWGALCVAILGGAGLILNHAGQTVPWLNPPVEVAQTTKAPDVAPPPSTAPVVAPVVAAPVPVVAPVVAAAPAPAPVVPAGPAWRVPVEPMAAAAMWPATENEVRASIEVANPVATAHSVGGPFVALLQPQFTAVYDLRTGRRSGFIKTAFQPNNLIVSSDGTMLAGLETGASEGMFAGADGSPVGGVEIWSTIDGHILGRVPTGAPGPIPQPLGFASGKLIATGSSNGVSGLQAWDITSGTIQHQWNTPPVSRSTMVISNSGQFVAVAASPVIRVFDVNSGEIAGELSAPFAVPRPTGMSFSPDGKTFAAIVRGTVEGSAGPNAGGLGATGSQSPGTLLEWNVADGGKLLRAVPIDLTATMPPFNATAGDNSAADAGDVAYLQWTPDGRMVRIGGGLFEITSGKTIFTLPPQMSGNLVGRFISVGNQRSTYEFLPTGIGSRLLIKTFDLPTATIDSAVAFAIASTSKPLGSGAELASAIGMPTTSPAVAASPTKASVRLSSGMNSGGSPTLSTSGPAYSALIVPSPTLSTAPPAHATVQLALQGNWDVQIKSIDRPDSMAIQQNLVTQTAELAQIQTNLERVIAKSDQVSRYQEFTQPDGEITRQYQYPDDVRTAADKALAKAQQQLRDAKVTVAKLQTAAAAAPTSRTVSSVLDNGVATTIQTDSTASAALVDLMHAGDRVHITGKGRVSQGILVVTLQTAMPLPQK
jgi:WD40 repeat protein